MSRVDIELLWIVALVILGFIMARYDWRKQHKPAINEEGRAQKLPVWPRWWCWLRTRHVLALRWADHLNDVSGIRCYCGKRVEHWYAGSRNEVNK